MSTSTLSKEERQSGMSLVLQVLHEQPGVLGATHDGRALGRNIIDLAESLGKYTKDGTIPESSGRAVL